MMRAASPAAERRVESGAGGQIGDDRERTGRLGRGIRHIREEHREAVHRGVVEHRDVDPRRQRLAQGAAERGRHRHRAGGATRR